MSDIAVIGGGIAGASVAYHLAERGVPTTVYERGSLASATTAKSAAFHGFRGGASPTQLAMKRYATRLYNAFLDEPRANPDHRLVGRLRVATTEAGAADLETSRDAIADRSAETGETEGPIVHLSGARLREAMVLPGLALGEVTGAIYRPNVGYFRPTELAHEFVERARERGATFVSNAAVESVVVEGGRVEAIVADGERSTVDGVVCAAGPWTRRIARSVGVDLPLRASLGPGLVLEPEGPIGGMPSLRHLESGVYLREHPGGRVFVGHYPGDYDEAGREIDPDGQGEEVPPDRLETMTDAVGRLVPRLYDAEVVDRWVGVRNLTPDGDPIVGPTAVEGFHVVAFDAAGIQLAPAAGQVVAARIADGDPIGRYGRVSVSRFGDDGADGTDRY